MGSCFVVVFLRHRRIRNNARAISSSFVRASAAQRQHNALSKTKERENTEKRLVDEFAMFALLRHCRHGRRCISAVGRVALCPTTATTTTTTTTAKPNRQPTTNRNSNSNKTQPTTCQSPTQPRQHTEDRCGAGDRVADNNNNNATTTTTTKTTTTMKTKQWQQKQEQQQNQQQQKQ